MGAPSEGARVPSLHDGLPSPIFVGSPPSGPSPYGTSALSYLLIHLPDFYLSSCCPGLNSLPLSASHRACQPRRELDPDAMTGVYKALISGVVSTLSQKFSAQSIGLS